MPWHGPFLEPEQVRTAKAYPISTFGERASRARQSHKSRPNDLPNRVFPVFIDPRPGCHAAPIGPGR